VIVLKHSLNNQSVDVTLHFLGDRRVRPITIVCITIYNLNLLISALILLCLHYKAKTALPRQRKLYSGKAKTMTPETMTKAKEPKNCLEAVLRQDTASRLNITASTMSQRC